MIIYDDMLLNILTIVFTWRSTSIKYVTFISVYASEAINAELPWGSSSYFVNK